MNQAFEIAGVGLATEQKALDVIANNIANLNTPAFKRSELRYSEVVTQVRDVSNPAADLTTEPSLSGVRAQTVLTLSEQGELEHTGRALDVAVQGDGFIELMGPHGQSLLWRGGTMHVQDDGTLAVGDGLLLRAMITIPPNTTELSIDPDGAVKSRIAGSDAFTELGRISLVRVDDPAALDRLDGGLYRVPEGETLSEVTPGEDGAGTLVQGAVEHSNVQITDEMVRLLVVQRAYAANAQIVQAADQMMAIANGLRR